MGPGLSNTNWGPGRGPGNTNTFPNICFFLAKLRYIFSLHFLNYCKITFLNTANFLGLFLFNIYLNDLFYLTEMTQLCNFADDTTFYVCDKDLNILINRLEHDTSLAVEWFENNFMKLNQDKCHLLVSGHEHEAVWAKIGETKIWESNKQKLLGVVIDRNLNFNEYVFDLCKKAGRKLSVLARLSNYMSFEERKILLKAFVESQF